MQKQTNYKKIHIQDLENRPQKETAIPSQKLLFVELNAMFISRGLRIRLRENCIKKWPYWDNHFFDAFKYAYMNHGDIILVPDEIWIMISFFVSQYIDKNSQALRKKLVFHERGFQVITVTQEAESQQESLLMQKNWDNFFQQVLQKIKQKTVKGSVQEFQCDFSTTTRIYKIISTSIIMNSLKSYFKYKRRVCACGISNVHMAGVREDWEKMIKKIDALNKYDVDGELNKYIQHMQVILKNFLQTFDEHPNVQWWNSIMKSLEQRETYGGQQTDVDGWILHFFGKYQKETIVAFPQMGIKVPILMINQLTNTQKQLCLVSDWVSVSTLNQKIYKPDVGVCIIQTGVSELEKKENP